MSVARQTDDGGMQEPPDDTDYAHRHHVNLVAAVVLLVIALALGWTVIAFERQEKLERCFEIGRRDCVPLETPSHVGIAPPPRAGK